MAGYTRVMHMRRCLSLLVGCVAVIWPSLSHAVTQTFSPEADARVERSTPGSNFGTSTWLKSDAGTTPMESYMRFQVANVSGTVTSAKLRVYVYNGSTGGTSLYRTQNSWVETAITWNNKPARDSAAIVFSGPVATNAWLELAVTPVVTGNGTYSFVFAQTSSDGVAFYSRQSSTNRPELVIVTSDGATDTIPPTLIPPPNMTVPATGPLTPVTLGAPTVSDNMDLAPRVTNNAPAAGFPLGATTVVWTATDASGNSTSAQQLITVSDTIAPTVAITAPVAGTAYTAAQTVTVAAAVADAVSVAKVEFYNGGVLKSTDQSSPFTFNWAITSALNGTHDWTAKAYDTAGNSSESGIVTVTVAIGTVADYQPSLPLRAMFYYPMFSEAWTQDGVFPFTNYHPTAGYYDTGNAAVLSQHLDAMGYGNIAAGVASWWGQGHHTDVDFRAMLGTTAGKTFRWAIYYESEGPGDGTGFQPTAEAIRLDLQYLKDQYWSNAGYLRIGGRPVLFVAGDPQDTCDSMAKKWKEANATFNAYLVLKMFTGYAGCAYQPDGWYQVAPASAVQSFLPHSYTISPGFWLKGEAVPRLERDPARWNQNIRDMLASGATFQLVTSFNDWGTGTAIEGAQEWQSGSGYGLYLDALHNNGQATAPIPDVVIAAAGDIACDPASSSFRNGEGTSTACRQKATSDLMLAMGSTLTAVLPLGDEQYENATLTRFNTSYDLSWGRLKSITRPAPGNHEYNVAGASGYYDYFGSLAGDRTKGYYSYDLGAWHLIALNSNCSAVGGCGATSAQVTWLKNDLAAHPNVCTLAYWHHPRFSSGSDHGDNTSMAAFWDALYAGGADLVLGGHSHDFERFAPMKPNGTRDDLNGIRSFVVGTGGKNLSRFSTTAAYRSVSEVRNDNTFGVLKLTLKAASYDWQFLPAPGGGGFADVGTGTCH